MLSGKRKRRMSGGRRVDEDEDDGEGEGEDVDKLWRPPVPSVSNGGGAMTSR